MKMKHKRLSRILSAFLVMVLGISFIVLKERATIYAYAIPSSLRVGLNVTEDAYSLSSASGLTYGYYEGSTYTSLETIAKNTAVFIRKDANFYNGTNLPVLYTSESSVPSGKTKYGSYRVQMGGTYASYSAAKTGAASYTTKFARHCYPAYTGTAWSVYTGDFTTAAQASSCITELKKKDANLAYTAVTQKASALVISDTNYKTLLFFDPGSGSRKFTAKPQAASPALLKLGTKQYRGYLEFRRFSGRDITVINTIGFDEYLYGVLPTEVSAGWKQPEVFKAQAVTARNFAYVNYKSSKHGNYDFNVCSTSCCQNYGGYSVEYPETNAGVTATTGQLLLYNNSPASIYYSASNGGYTEGTENVWSSAMPYYKTLPDQYDPKNYKLYTMTAAEASASLKAKGYDVGDLKSIEITKRSASGRVLELVVTGTKGSKTVTKNTTRGVFGLQNQMYNIRTDTVYTMLEGSISNSLLEYLNGTRFTKIFLSLKTFTLESIPAGGISKFNQYYYEKVTINSQSDKLYFDVYGNGHGVGMSQLGALEMARQGKTYKEIMSFYYPGTVVG